MSPIALALVLAGARELGWQMAAAPEQTPRPADAGDPRESIAILMIVFARRDGEVSAAALDYIKAFAANRLMSSDAAGLLARAGGNAATLRDPAEAVCRLAGRLQQQLGNAEKRKVVEIVGLAAAADGPPRDATMAALADLKRRLFQA